MRAALAKKPATWAVHLAALVGWKSLVPRWIATVKSVPQRGTELVVR